MSEKTTTVFTCDRCGTTAKSDGRGACASKPPGWEYVTLPIQRRISDLCPSCLVAMANLVKGFFPE